MLLLLDIAVGQDVDYDDLPTQCQGVCGPIVNLTQRCDQSTNNDLDQLNCVCSTNNVNVTLPVCEACYAMFGSDGHDNGKYDAPLARKRMLVNKF